MNFDKIFQKFFSPVNTVYLATQLQSSIIDHLPNHYIFWKDVHSVFLGCNKAFALSANLKSPSEIIGKTDYDLPWSKEESDNYIADDQQVMKSRKPKLNIEEPQTLPNGKKIILLTSKVPLFDQKGEVCGVLAIYSDITEQKLNEKNLIESNKKLERANQVKSEFIRNVSHDIRTPLSGIQQATRMIYENKISEEEIPEYAFAAWEASNKLMELFNQIIEISKKQHFSFEDQIVKFDLYNLLEELEKTYLIVAKHKNIKLEIEYSPKVPRFLLGKNHLLHRILMNLLGNALKFTNEGSVKLLVEKAQENEGKVILRFSVIDTGIGIAKEKHDMIFEPFVRIFPSFQGQYQGSGLGLHVVKDYINKMQGEIYVESEEGQGSMFTCIIPFKRPILDNDNDIVETDYDQKLPNNIQPPKDFAKVNPTFSEIKHSQYRVLLVEDDKLMQTIGLALLKEMSNYQIDLAKSGEEALELTTKFHYDIIYMDIGLPKLNGIEVVRQIRATNNPSQNAFIAALTAHADEDITKQCLDVGMQLVLYKPLTPEKVQQVQSLIKP